MVRFGLETTGKVVLGLALGAAAAATAQPSRAQSAVDDFRVKTEKWVETRQILSEEKSSWEAERETLRATRDLLKQQREILQEEVEKLEASNTEADEERNELLLERGEYQRANRALEERIRALEQQVLALAPRLPAPLQHKLEPLLVQVPEDPEAANLQLGQRLVNVLGVLAQTERFNGTTSFVGETRAVQGGQKVQVRTLYWGLGQAFYVDARGEIAGVGRPGVRGWEFSDRPELREEAKLLLDIYEGNVDVIQFVRLPVEIR